MQRSLRRFAKDFGDSNAQAICRWGVSACREAAKQTQVWGDKSKAAKEKQWGAIDAGARACLIVLEPNEKPRKGKRNLLDSPDAINQWIEANRRKSGRVTKLPPEEKKEATADAFRKAMAIRQRLAGIAKGAWLGAGMEIAKRQRGAEKLAIGKNFLGYAQKHASLGRITFNPSSSNPFGLFHNTARHSASSWVVKPSAIREAMDWGLLKTVSWYRRALKAQDKKKP